MLSLAYYPHGCNLQPPLEENRRGCHWAISLDHKGCRRYYERCDTMARCRRRNEIFWECSMRCEPTCENQKPVCDMSCDLPRCQCMQGFFRDRFGHCVPPSQCRPQASCSPWSSCPAGSTCQEGECIVLQEPEINSGNCLFDSDCPGSMICAKRNCWPRECAEDKHCPVGHWCEYGRCKLMWSGD
ncbi:hypothetical protein Tcan_08419 [Toxocara canis]|uniref:TIL domain-containing protein n=1 Tax=Toxocara canis TaxID=6265 RepID=A0A0B2VSS2_TOXCA|nr:hypothetical protein Tcan_08419 [Toxocara canis]